MKNNKFIGKAAFFIAAVFVGFVGAVIGLYSLLFLVFQPTKVLASECTASDIGDGITISAVSPNYDSSGNITSITFDVEPDNGSTGAGCTNSMTAFVIPSSGNPIQIDHPLWGENTGKIQSGSLGSSTAPVQLKVQFENSTTGEDLTDTTYGNSIPVKQDGSVTGDQLSIVIPDSGSMSYPNGSTSGAIYTVEIHATINGNTTNNSKYSWTWSSNNGVDLSKQKDHWDFTYGFDASKDYLLTVTATGPDQNGKMQTLGPVSQTLQISSTRVGNAIQKGNNACGGGGVTFTCVVNQIVTGIAGVITELVASLSNLIITPIIRTMLAIQPHENTFANVILQGWVVIRNLSNILFILALIVVGFGTILRLDRYNYKSLLTTIVIMALLVNFSLAIAQGILGVADTLQAQFLPNNAKVIDSLSYELIAGPNHYLQAGAALNTGSFGTSVSALIYVVFGIAAFIVLLALAAMLLIRIVALWLLLLVSPIAYAGLAFPWARNLGSMWWKEFFRYAFFTPLIALALNLCAFLAQSNAKYIAGSAQTAFPTAPIPGFASSLANIVTTLLVMGCLTASLSIANKMGIKGADKVTKWADDRISDVTKRPAKVAQNYARYKKDQLTAGLLNRPDAGAVRVGFARALNPVKTFNDWRAGTAEKYKKETELKDAAMSRRRDYAKSSGGIDNEADIKLLRRRDDEVVNQKLSLSQMDWNKEMNKFNPNSSEYNPEFASSDKGIDYKRQVIKAGLQNGRFKNYVRDVYAKGKAEEIWTRTDLSEEQKKEQMQNYGEVNPDGSIKGKYTPAAADEFMKTYIDHDPAMLRDANEIGTKTGRLELVGRDQKGDTDEETQTKRRDARVNAINSADSESFKNLKFDLINPHADDNPTETSKELEALLIKVNDDSKLVLNENQLKFALGFKKFDARTGAPIFEDPNDVERFNNLYREKPALITRLYNDAIGATREQERLQFVPGGWLKTETGYNRTEIDGRGPVGEMPNADTEKFQVDLTRKPVKNYQNWYSRRGATPGMPPTDDGGGGGVAAVPGAHPVQPAPGPTLYGPDDRPITRP